MSKVYSPPPDLDLKRTDRLLPLVSDHSLIPIRKPMVATSVSQLSPCDPQLVWAIWLCQQEEVPILAVVSTRPGGSHQCHPKAIANLPRINHRPFHLLN